MEETLKIFIGILLLLLAWPVGDFLAKITKEELKQGQMWFKLITIVGLATAFVALILRNDALLFASSFIAIVASRSLKK